MSVIPAISNRSNENTKTYVNSNNQDPSNINNLIAVPAGIAAGSASAFAINQGSKKTIGKYLINLAEKAHDATFKGFSLTKIAELADQMIDENIGKRKGGFIPKELSFSYSTPGNL